MALTPIFPLVSLVPLFWSSIQTSILDVVFSCCVSLVSFNLEEFLSVSLSFMMLTFQMNTGQFLCGTSLKVDYIVFLYDSIQIMNLWQGSHRSDISGYMISISKAFLTMT